MGQDLIARDLSGLHGHSQVIGSFDRARTLPATPQGSVARGVAARLVNPRSPVQPPGLMPQGLVRLSSEAMGIEARRNTLTPEQVREELDQFEERFGVSSENRREAFDDDLCDSDELARWSALYRMWQRSQQRAAR